MAACRLVAGKDKLNFGLVVETVHKVDWVGRWTLDEALSVETRAVSAFALACRGPLALAGGDQHP